MERMMVPHIALDDTSLEWAAPLRIWVQTRLSEQSIPLKRALEIYPASPRDTSDITTFEVGRPIGAERTGERFLSATDPRIGILTYDQGGMHLVSDFEISTVNLLLSKSMPLQYCARREAATVILSDFDVWWRGEVGDIGRAPRHKIPPSVSSRALTHPGRFGLAHYTDIATPFAAIRFYMHELVGEEPGRFAITGASGVLFYGVDTLLHELRRYLEHEANGTDNWLMSKWDHWYTIDASPTSSEINVRKWAQHLLHNISVKSNRIIRFPVEGNAQLTDCTSSSFIQSLFHRSRIKYATLMLLALIAGPQKALKLGLAKPMRVDAEWTTAPEIWINLVSDDCQLRIAAESCYALLPDASTAIMASRAPDLYPSGPSPTDPRLPAFWDNLRARLGSYTRTLADPSLFSDQSFEKRFEQACIPESLTLQRVDDQ